VFHIGAQYYNTGLMLFNRLAFTTLLEAAMPIDIRLPLTSVGGGGLVFVLGPDCQLFG